MRGIDLTARKTGRTSDRDPSQRLAWWSGRIGSANYYCARHDTAGHHVVGHNATHHDSAHNFAAYNDSTQRRRAAIEFGQTLTHARQVDIFSG